MIKSDSAVNIRLNMTMNGIAKVMFGSPEVMLMQARGGRLI